MRRAPSIVPFIPYAVVSVLHVLLGLFDLPGGGYETKQLLMATLGLAAVWATAAIRPWPRGAVLLLLVAIAASFFGDGAGLFFPDFQPVLLPMMLCFALAHLAYIALFLRAPGVAPTELRRLPWWSLVYAAWWFAAIAIVGPHAGALFVPLAVYGAVLGGTAVLSTRFGPLVATGGAFFLLSDTLIAFREFLEVPSWMSDLVMPTYELGQGLIVFGVVASLRRSAAAFEGRAVADG